MIRVEDAAALIPVHFVEQVAGLAPAGGPSGADWAAGLPHLLAEVLDAWRLSPQGPALTRHRALVLPVRGPEGAAALKLGWPHADADGEHLALRAWQGRSAVRLLRADPRRSVLLLERLTAEDLSGPWIDEAVEAVARLYPDLHLEPLAQVPQLATRVAGRLARPGAQRLPRRLVEQARSTLSGLAADPGAARLLHGDLHYGNVCSDGTDWVAIDPAPLTGHPAWEVAPLLSHRVQEMGTGASLRWSVRRRLEIVCEVAGLEQDVVRPVSALRELINAIGAVEDGDAARVSLAISLIKALGD